MLKAAKGYVLDVASVTRGHDVMRACRIDTDGADFVVRQCIAARLHFAFAGVKVCYPTLRVGYP